MIFKIKEVPTGYIVQRQVKKWYGKKWIPYIVTSGLPDRAWVFNSVQSARRELPLEVIREVERNLIYEFDNSK